MNPKYEAVIGLEVHAQLLTDTKIFCGCSTKFGNEPNSNTCPVCLGHPGVLPVLNKKVIEFTVLMGFATNSIINKQSVFARKNYFYPDLPKGYQISQYEEPICEHGFVEIHPKNSESEKIGITRIHMEEDAGKSIHDQNTSTLIDVNRCGVPLIEIVSEPDIRTPEEAYLYLTKIKQLVQYLGICDGNMEEGSLRCDANISVRLKGENQLGVKTEIKNLNSFRNVERAIEYEVNRQTELIEDGEKIVLQTLLWDADANEAHPMRSKEEAHDYRYFPDPDLLPVEVDNQWLKELKSLLVELPDEKLNRFVKNFELPLYDSEIITNSRDLADYYENIISVTDEYKLASNWLIGDVLSVLNEKKLNITEFSVSPDNIGKLINLIKAGTISSKIAKEVFAEMLNNNSNPEDIVKEKNLVQISDPDELLMIIKEITEKNPEQVSDYKSGKEKVFGFFVGQIMKQTKGKANPKLVNDLLKQVLSN
ncbi:MAG: Asp-tRNA(Asn)/Glu-tRNA(Gln) amidotransferase subunit GatB [Ignavibacteriaceae bacterium]|jgi:aspartyl-tRNA(Asn)/glutamyl-tRNA(Gln) amidotransferase subunit B|nr:Asp-tRNA(Asn)/Glu-tRNA(Gln) amidotransferase subunit GatB [Ignavibacteriaceae bacterium]